MIYLKMICIDGQDGITVEARCPTVAQQVYLYGLVKTALKDGAIPPIESLVLAKWQEQEFTLLDKNALGVLLTTLVDHNVIFCLSTDRIELQKPINEIYRLQSTKLYFSSDFVIETRAHKQHEMRQQEKAAINDFNNPGNCVWRECVPEELKPDYDY